MHQKGLKFCSNKASVQLTSNLYSIIKAYTNAGTSLYSRTSKLTFIIREHLRLKKLYGNLLFLPGLSVT